MFPRISVVTSSYNQGRFLARTIESVLAQDYPNLEHIVVDGMSTDGTPNVLARYPHLRVLREPDRGQAEAINKGFRLATGDIFCFLNSDDTFRPGALHRVAREIDPVRGRHIVQGRCRYVDEDDVWTGEEHPSLPASHSRILQVWKTHCVPQPATFWTAELWKRCGPMDETLHLALDYDLFCRFSRRYRFHFVDAVLADYRLHGASKTCSNEQDAVREQAIAISRRYWGSPLRLKYWLLRASLAWFRFKQAYEPQKWSYELMKQVERSPRGLRRRALIAKAVLLSARARLREFVVPPRLLPLWDRLFERRSRSSALAGLRETRAEDLVWRGFTGRHADGMIGPVFETDLVVEPSHDTLHLEAEEAVRLMPRPFVVEVELDGQLLHRCQYEPGGPLHLSIPLRDVAVGSRRLTLCCGSFATIHDWRGGGDLRPLSLLLKRIALSSSASGDAGPLSDVA
jgi:glycosyltransferase involved in cell wall biosynthesis